MPSRADATAASRSGRMTSKHHAAGADAREALSLALSTAEALGLETHPDELHIEGQDGVLPVRYPLGIAAAGVLGAAGLALAALGRARGAPAQRVAVDLGHAAFGLVGFRQLRLDGRPISSPGDANPLVGLYRCRDGAYIAIHGGFESLRAPTLRLLGAEPTVASLTSAIGLRDSVALEESMAAHGLCAVVCRSAQAWQRSDPGRALAAEPLVEVARIGDADPAPWPAWRPGQGGLGGVRVLDCTRVLAGPTCSRFLAAADADVLVPTPARLPNVEGYALETGQGKRFLPADLDEPCGHALALALADSCDVLVDSYRSGSLGRRGLGAAALAARRSRVGIVHVSINCYGHSGPWAVRPGWELMAQAATGLAVGQGGAGPPQPLWVYPCDYLTGYLGAIGVLVALLRRAREGGSWQVRVSLARTGMHVQSLGARFDPTPSGTDRAADYCEVAHTPDGRLRYLPVPVQMSLTPLRGWRARGRPPCAEAPWLDAGSGLDGPSRSRDPATT